MKKVNLLPRWYIHERRDRRLFRTRLFLICCMAAVMIVWKIGDDQYLAKLAATAGELHEQQAIVGNLATELSDRRTFNTKLKQLAADYRELGQPAPSFELLQQIHNELTPGMALTAVAMDIKKDPVAGSGNVGDKSNPPRYRHTAVFRIDGIAPDDQVIAQMVDRLTHNPLFLDVSMNFTKPDVLRGVVIRRFQIRLSVDLERIPIGDPDATMQALVEQNQHAT